MAGRNENPFADMALQHYRLAVLGSTLSDTVEELVEINKFDPAYRELVLENLEKAICKTLAKEVKTKAKIEGEIIYYRSHSDIWSIFAKDLKLMIDGKMLEMQGKTHIIAVRRQE